MSKPLYIYSFSHFLKPVEDAPSNLKADVVEACGKSIRRIDRLTQLALVGCFQCKATKSIAENTGLYLSSFNGSLNNMTKVLAEIYVEGELPRPLSFINTVSNSACFYLARELNILGYNQFVSCSEFAFESAIKLAQLDLRLQKVDAALMGVISEVGPDLAIHRRRLGFADQYQLCEGSHWLYLAEDIEGEVPIAEIVDVLAPVDFSSIQDVLRDKKMAEAVVVFGENVADDAKQEIIALSQAKPASFLSGALRHESLSAIEITGFLSQEQGEAMIYVDVDRQGCYSLVLIKRLRA